MHFFYRFQLLRYRFLLEASRPETRLGHHLLGVSVRPVGLRVVRGHERVGREVEAPGRVVPGVELEWLFVLQRRDDEGEDHGQADEGGRQQDLDDDGTMCNTFFLIWVLLCLFFVYVGLFL